MPNSPWRRNGILASLPEGELIAMLPKLEPVPLPAGVFLHESGQTLTHVHFPIDAIVSLLHVTESGASADLALIGREGMVGVTALLGGDRTPSRAVVQAAGIAYRMTTKDVRMHFAASADFQLQILRFTHALMTQVSQTAVCNLHHSVEQQLCRWMLLSLDRLPASEIHMTHELIASMLGVRRQGVTEATRRLEQRGVLRCARGRITVLDRPALERCACECYRAVCAQTAAYVERL
jgi:CRP-like cAMP-binding protein